MPPRGARPFGFHDGCVLHPSHVRRDKVQVALDTLVSPRLRHGVRPCDRENWVAGDDVWELQAVKTAAPMAGGFRSPVPVRPSPRRHQRGHAAWSLTTAERSRSVPRPVCASVAPRRVRAQVRRHTVSGMSEPGQSCHLYGGISDDEGADVAQGALPLCDLIHRSCHYQSTPA
jgi:hypothetical protein